MAKRLNGALAAELDDVGAPELELEGRGHDCGGLVGAGAVLGEECEDALERRAEEGPLEGLQQREGHPVDHL